MSVRYVEFKSLFGNLVYWDVVKDSLEVDDIFKWKVIIEMKLLVLYSKQCVLREKIGK